MLAFSASVISNRFIDNPSDKGKSNDGVVVCDMGNVPLLPGEYDIDVYFGDQHSDLGVIEQTIVRFRISYPMYPMYPIDFTH